MGNLIPAITWLPATVIGILLIQLSHDPLGLGFRVLIGGQILTLVVLNFTGLFENNSMRRALYREFQVLRPNHRGWKMFVGYASERYSSWLDPHEDLGYCCLTPDTFEFYGDSKIRTVKREQVSRIRWKPNVHSLLGMGRWIVIEAVQDGKLVTLKFEPRDRDNLFGNLLLGRKLKQRLENWLQKKTPPGENPGGRHSG